MTRAASPLLFVALALGACQSHPDSVCEDLGNCSFGGDTDFVDGCQAQAKDLRAQANDSGCGGLFDDYFRCADDNFSCEGNVTRFPGCEGALVALTQCLERAAAHNACGALDQALAACNTDDAGAAGTSAIPSACVGQSVCAAACYLDNVSDVCAPHPTELTAVESCNRQCVF